MLKALQLYKHPKLLNKVLNLRGRVYTYISPLHVSIATAKEPFSVEQGDYKRIRQNKKWGKVFTSAQFHVKGTVPSGYDKNTLAIIADIGGEGQLFDANGQPIIALTNRIHSSLDFFQAHKGKSLIELSMVTTNDTIDFFIEAGYNGILPMLPTGTAKFKGVFLVQINAQCKEFFYDYLNLVYQYLADKNAVNYKKLDLAYNLFIKNQYDKAKAVIKEITANIKTADYSLYAVGHSHLDLAWMWPIRETKRKAVRTISNQLYNIEKYPYYNYGISQPQQLQWIKEKYPQFFEIIKQKIKDGRIEIQGGMWTEADINLSGGESLIRQIYYGQKFWQENFNKVSTICWLPDVFGYSASLPQILLKSGIDNFMTIKLSWNEVNKFPHNTFNWAGIDNSTVLVHMPPTGSYNSDATAFCVESAIKNNKEKHVKESLFLFGAGDGGGGASEAQLELITRQANYKDAVLKFSSAEDFFKDLRQKNYDLPNYKGELYLEKHQGTLTTQGKIKFYNRYLEWLMQVAEVVCVHNYIKNKEYQTELIDNIWQEILLYQFHDILPGSSINRVNVECVERYLALEKQILSLIEDTAQKIGGLGGYFNASPMSIDNYFLENDNCINLKANQYSSCKYTKIIENSDNFVYSDTVMESDNYKLVFNANGSFEMFDKLADKNLGSFNNMVIYCDPYKYYNAWDINHKYINKRKRYFKVSNVETKVFGNILIRKQQLHCGGSYINQTIYLKENSKVVEIKNTAKLSGILRMLRMDNRLTVWDDLATFDIQFGTLKRSTKDSNSIEKAQFEVCAHKFVDVRDKIGGITIMNNCKYGHRVKDGLISLNLIRKPIFPDKHADRGEHDFTVGIMASEGDKIPLSVVQNAYAINRPPIIVDANIEPLFDIEGNVVIETIKKGIRNGTIAIRCYEPLGQTTTTAIIPKFAYTNVQETNLMEVNNKDIDLSNIAFTPFEIKTIVFKI